MRFLFIEIFALIYHFLILVKLRLLCREVVEKEAFTQRERERIYEKMGH